MQYLWSILFCEKSLLNVRGVGIFCSYKDDTCIFPLRSAYKSWQMFHMFDLISKHKSNLYTLSLLQLVCIFDYLLYSWHFLYVYSKCFILAQFYSVQEMFSILEFFARETICTNWPHMFDGPPNLWSRTNCIVSHLSWRNLLQKLKKILYEYAFHLSLRCILFSNYSLIDNLFT